MTKIGYALSSEEFTAPELVRNATLAKESGLQDFMISDHFHPSTDRQGNTPFVWSVIGAMATATDGARIGAMGPDPERYVRSVQEYVDACLTELYMHQIGPDQEGFLRFWNAEVAPRLGL